MDILELEDTWHSRHSFHDVAYLVRLDTIFFSRGLTISSVTATGMSGIHLLVSNSKSMVSDLNEDVCGPRLP